MDQRNLTLWDDECDDDISTFAQPITIPQPEPGIIQVFYDIL